MPEKKVGMTVEYFNMTAECSTIRDKYSNTRTTTRQHL